MKLSSVVSVLTALLSTSLSLSSTDFTQDGDISQSGYSSNHNFDPAKLSQYTVSWTSSFNKAEYFYAKPLVYTPAGAAHELVYVVSNQNIVRVLDGFTGDVLLSRTLEPPFQASDTNCGDIPTTIGIIGTPVIDALTERMYFWSKSYIDGGKGPQSVAKGNWKLYAVKLSDLSDAPGFPISIQGLNAHNDHTRYLISGTMNQRPGLAMLGNTIITGFGSHCDNFNFTGYLVTASKTPGVGITDIQAMVAAPGAPVPQALDIQTQRNGKSGIWQAGFGLALDPPKNRVFFAVGNGQGKGQLMGDDGRPVNGKTYLSTLENSVASYAIDPATGKLTQLDWFCPTNYDHLNGADRDLGSSGVALLDSNPFSGGGVNRIAIAAGKAGTIIIMDADNLGGFKNGPHETDGVLQIISPNGASFFSGVASYPLEGGYIYFVPTDDSIYVYKFGMADGLPRFTLAGKTALTFAGRGAPRVTSLNGQPGTGIVWLSDINMGVVAYHAVPVNGVLEPYKFPSTGRLNKFQRPSFGNARVYTSEQNSILGIGEKSAVSSLLTSNSYSSDSKRSATIPSSSGFKHSSPSSKPISSTSRISSSKSKHNNPSRLKPSPTSSNLIASRPSSPIFTHGTSSSSSLGLFYSWPTSKPTSQDFRDSSSSLKSSVTSSGAPNFKLSSSISSILLLPKRLLTRAMTAFKSQSSKSILLTTLTSGSTAKLTANSNTTSTISTYVTPLPAAGIRKNINWNLTWVNVAPDGYMRPMIGINGQWPCPPIVLNYGDTLILNVYNGLGNESASVHFHGIFQKNTTFEDGSTFATQCPIPPGNSFTYQFIATQVGTFWYHSHHGGQYIDGLRGPLIINDPSPPYGNVDQEFILTLSDHYHEEAPYLINYYQSVHNTDLNGGIEPVPDANLINDAQNVNITMIPSQMNLFRIINMGAVAGQYLQFDQHTMTIVEIDGQYVMPYDVQQLFVAVGQRYSVIVKSSTKGDQNFAIVATMNADMFYDSSPPLNPTVYGWLVYNESAHRPAPFVLKPEPFTDTVLIPLDQEPLLDPPSETIYMAADFGPDENGITRGYLNGVSYVNQKVPTLYTVLTAPTEHLNNTAIYGMGSNPMILPHGAIIEIEITNHDDRAHPFHLHGHAFQVIYRSDAGYLYPGLYDTPTIPMKRDVVIVYAQSTATIRFVADNPGIQLFHCHTEWHVVSGMMATFIEAPTELVAQKPYIPASHRALCDDYNIPRRGNAAGNSVDWLDMTDANTQASTNNWGALTNPPS